MAEPTCLHCRCTDGRACDGGCFWVLPGVCSRCVLNGLATAGTALAEPHRRQLAGELLCLADAVDGEAYAFDHRLGDGGTSPGFEDAFDQLVEPGPRLWRPGDPV